MAKLFDPLGITLPIIIKSKILFQKLSKQDWDKPVDKTIQRDWFKFVSELLEIKSITVPRCYFNFRKGILGSTLHTFCDASVLVFASVVYLVIQTPTDYHSCLVTSKSRVAPLGEISLPRLELLGALTGSRLAKNLQEAIENVVHIDEVVCWSDSLVTLYWIKGTCNQFKQFIENCVSEVQKHTQVETWHHIPKILNPADIPVHGLDATEFVQSELWFNGPDFIRKPKEFWPVDILKDMKEPPPEALVEEKSSATQHTLLTTEKVPTVNLKTLLTQGDFI